MVMTFMSPSTLREIKESKGHINGKDYCETTGSYCIGVIPKVDDARTQAVLLCSYLSDAKNTICVLLEPSMTPSIYNIVDVANGCRILNLSPAEDCLGVVDEISAVMIKSAKIFENVVSYHDLTRYYLSELLNLFGHTETDFVKEISWLTIERQWCEMEKTNTLTSDNYRLIKKAIKG